MNYTNNLYSVLLLAIVYALATAAPSRAQVSMYADPTAHEAGDMLTIILAERTSAQREASWQKEASADKNVSSAFGASALTGQFAADARYNSDVASRNQSVQTHALTGTIAAHVTEVDQNGNLIIQGERRLNINGETHLLRISGTVRPYDIRYNNSVLSYQIADASIEYRQLGRRSRRFAPAFWARIGAVTAAGVGILLAVLR